MAATATQLKALLESYKNGDDERFKSIAKQIAAHEANKGNENLSLEIKSIIGKFSERTENKIASLSPISFLEPRGELSGLFQVECSKIKLNNMILPEALSEKLNRIIEEQNRQQELRDFGLLPRSKILMIGEPGTGKTMTASALSGQLNLPLFVIQLDGLITKYMGETSSKLRLIFDHIRKIRGVYFFDEFDAIGGSRSLNNDVGEVRRILNTFLQFIENSRSDSLIVAATNHSELLDKALFRRFDDILKYEMPTHDLMKNTFKKYLTSKYIKKVELSELIKEIDTLSYAEIVKLCNNAIKANILQKKEIDNKLLYALIEDLKEHR